MRRPDPDVKRALDAFRRVVQALRLTAREAERSVGLSAAQLFVLQKLAEVSRLSINELAARTHTHQSSVSVVVQRLAKGGWVRRVRSNRDRRTVEVCPTPRGLALLRRAPEAAQERLVAGLLELPPRSRRQLAELLDRLVRQAGFSAGLPELFFEPRTRPEKSRPRARI